MDIPVKRSDLKMKTPVSIETAKSVRRPTVQDLMVSIAEGFDKLYENGVSVELPYTKLRLLDDLLWNTLVSLGLG